MNTNTTMVIKVDVRENAPITPITRSRLLRDSQNVRATAIRKGVSLDKYEEVRESLVAKKHFELGCWLHYYSDRVGLPTGAGLKTRVECALRLFLNGIINPTYDFFTVFDFGERQFDGLFEAGDADQVLAHLRQALATDSTGMIAKAFAHFGWAIEA